MKFDLSAPDGAATPVVDLPTSASPSPFDALEGVVPTALRDALEARGFETLTEVQRVVLDADARGRDLQVSSQTGSGKTVALGFVLAPQLAEAPEDEGPTALVIVPTRELANQVSEELRWLFAGLAGVRVTAVTGGTSVVREQQLLARGPRVVVGTPGRLLDHVTRGALVLRGIRELVLDEADQMLDMGFREELEGILDATPATRRTHLVSATFPEGIRRLAERYQTNPLSIEGTRLGDANEDIEHEGYLVPRRDRYAVLVNRLLLAGDDRVLVFVERRADALEVAEKLEADGFAALPLSGELAQSQRARTLAAFRAGRAKVLVATDVAARGLDVPDVATVIHTAPPIDAEAYTHRSGRTGRAGKRGTSVLLAPPSHRRRVKRLVSEAGIDLRFHPVPTADQVRAELTRRARAERDETLERAVADAGEAEHREHAEALLERHDAAPLVAALLGLVASSKATDPREVGQQPDPTERGDRDDGYRRKPSNGPRRERPSGPRDAVRFFVNRGHNQGATPSRVLAAVCRRGEVTGKDIGAIAIHPNACTFDVHESVAEHFERRAGRRDARDPQMTIRRDRGPLRAQGRHDRHGPRD